MTATDTARWLPVVGHEGVNEVSEDGRVRLLARRSRRSNSQPYVVPGHELRASLGAYGYLQVAIGGGVKRRTVTVHQLVAEAFIGPCPPGQQVCHNDGNKMNNHRRNLRYGTPAENIADSMQNGTVNWGGRSVPLTESQVADIRESHQRGANQREIAERYAVSQSTVSLIINRKGAWRER